MSRAAGSPAPVAINGRAAVRAQIGGVERLAREMAHHLPALRPDRYGVIRPPARLAHRAGHMWEQIVLPLQSAGSRLVYSPANLAPVACRRNVVVIHDVAALRHPEAYSPPYVAYQRLMLPALARRARMVMTVSEFSKHELIEVLDVPAERIAVVPEGVADSFAARAAPAQVARRYGLERPYVLTVATASERKNLGALARAVPALRERGIEFVLAGSGRSYLRSEWAGPPDHAPRRLGYVPEADLPGLYAGARVLAMPSRYEGFGLPCLEAMACGTPVVAARAGALPETVGDAALLVDPLDADGFTESLLAAASDDAVRDALIAAGARRAARFTWRRTATLTDETLASLLEGE